MRTFVFLLSFLLLTSSVGAQVGGTVVDDVTDEPISEAVVSVQASDIETSTDPTGAYSLADATGQGLVIVAGAKGYFYSSAIATSPESNLELRLEPVPQVDDRWYTFQPPEKCRACHEEQYQEWKGSPMSKAGLNTWVYDIYNGTGTDGGKGGFVYTDDSVHAEENPESECASCHQPEPWAREPFTALGDFDDPTPAMEHGVACDMCHRIADIDIDKPNFPGIYPGVVTLTRPVGPNEIWKVMYGVLGDADFYQRGWMRASYQPQLKSEICAACHQDKNDPDLSGDFESEDAVMSEPTYDEWSKSDYADPSSDVYAECVDCHMPATGASAACDRVGFTRPDGDVRSHNILGTTPEFLENALTMTMDARIEGDSLLADVAIENDRTGHHVPTGVTIRNMILLVEAWQVSDGAPLDQIGGPTIHTLGGNEGGPEEGYYAGLPGRLYGKINIAAPVPPEEEGASPTFFTDAVAIVSDNRIPALETDESSYAFDVPLDAGEIKVRARVIYRRSWRALVDAKQWKYDGHDNPLEDIAPPHFGHLMDMAEMTFNESPPAPMPDAGVPDGGEPDGGEPPPDGSSGGCTVSAPQSSATGLLWLLSLALIALGAIGRSRRRSWLRHRRTRR